MTEQQCSMDLSMNMDQLLKLRREYLEAVARRSGDDEAKTEIVTEKEDRRQRKARTAFSDSQLQLLETTFEQHKYLSVIKRQISILIIYSVKQWQLTTKMWNLRSRLDFIRILQLISLNPRQKGLFYSIWRNIFLTNVMINKLSLNYQNYYKISFNK